MSKVFVLTKQVELYPGCWEFGGWAHRCDKSKRWTGV
jgi:hypothetical protein